MDRDEFGNVSFGETTKLLVSIIGQDAILSLLPKEPKNEQVSFKRKLSRVYNEDKIEYFKLATQEKDNPQDYFLIFFEKLENDYKVPEFVKDLVNDTIWQLFHATLSNTPFEKYKSDTVKYLFRKQVFHLLSDLTKKSHLQKKIDKFDLISFLSKIHDLPDTYKLIFSEAAKTISKKNLSLLLDKFSDININLQTISRWDKGVKATWKSIKLILDFFDKENKKDIIYKLLAVYFIKNAKNAFDELKLITNDEFDKIIKDVISMLIENRNPEEFYDTAFGISDSVEYHDLINRCLFSIGQSNNDIEKLINELEQKCPNSKKFFLPWIKAKISLFRDNQNINLKEVQEYYRNAFDNGKYYAGCFLWQFILEAIALENYSDNKVGNLNDYYAFGYSLEMFTGEKEILLESLDSIKKLSLFEQYDLIKEFCCFLWNRLLLNVPYNPPQSELLFKRYLQDTYQINSS